MDRKNVVWILLLLLLGLLTVAETVDTLTDLENIAGKLIFYQMEGNATYVRDSGELASDVPTETMFELFDPQQNFSSAKFTYTWDLGNGEVIQGTEPVVRYHYSESGNYTLRLKVGVNVTKYTPPITGVYSTDLQVLDAIKHIEMTGPSDYEVSQNTGLAFHVDGSPPMWVCWRFLPNCVPDMTGGCTLTMLYENTLRLNHTFTSVGVHCLDISVRNDISKMQTSFSLYVKRNTMETASTATAERTRRKGPSRLSNVARLHDNFGDSYIVRVMFPETEREQGKWRNPGISEESELTDNPHILFILSCAAILVATFSFITVIACRPRHPNRSQIAASSNALFLKSHEDSQSAILFNFPKVERGENEPLLLQYGTQYSC